VSKIPSATGDNLTPQFEAGKCPDDMRAHQEMHEATVTGNLVRRGTRYMLTRASGFRIG
jgi:hypothetical protein